MKGIVAALKTAFNEQNKSEIKSLFKNGLNWINRWVNKRQYKRTFLPIQNFLNQNFQISKNCRVSKS